MTEQEPSLRRKFIGMAEDLAQQKDAIEASGLPPQVKEQKIEVIDSELERLAKAYNSLLRY